MSLNYKSLGTWVLIVSLTLNLLLIGGISARFLNRSSIRPLPSNVGWLLRDLDTDTRDQLRPQLEQYAEETRPLRGNMFRAQRQLNSLMATDPLDQEAIRAAFAELRRTNLVYQEASHEQTLSILAALTPEQRQYALSFMRNRRNPMDDDRRDGDRWNGDRRDSSRDSR
ncbi:MAG: periplasmic heavy metal sensor [Pseudomonadales bacterium]|nr:periplasmic heavy metal sensor [Pseudomonadales bacterium]